ncbi:extracellular solute-binding protein [Micromonospora sp. WMMD1128]|uniref:extracellular solute-binding protein n=1 Tax=Micromonospora sp. WMMD1128 TaxID=3015150 RepID=UPI00248CF30D|nr:extracellular solute-binding protein [Micromonospora sp. WMMD1128]WBB72329.1 extracellular solute-binding protein [Micromonospora sp. WMMD1128]
MPRTPSTGSTPRNDRRRWWWAFGLGLMSGALVAALTSVLVWRVAGPRSPEPGDLLILTGRDDSEGQQRQFLIDLWNTANPGNQAKMISLSETADAQYAEMVNRGEKNGKDDGTEIDVFNLDVTWTAAFAEKDLLRPIDEGGLADRPDEVFLKQPLRTCRYRDRLWALPFNTDAGLLYYRKDLGLKPPFDWPEIEAESARLLPRTPGLTAGYAGQLGDYEGLTVNALEALWAHGGDLRVDDQGNASIDPKRLAAALKPLTPSDAGPSVAFGEERGQQTEEQSRQTFADGHVAFMRNWPVAYRRLTGDDATSGPSPAASKDTTAMTEAAKKVGVAALPGPSVLGGQNLAIARQTGQPRAAQLLIEYLTGEQSQRTLFEKGGFAATRAVVYEDVDIQNEYPYLPLLLEAIKTARLRPVSPQYVNFSRVLRGYVGTVLDGKGSLPDDLAQRLTDALHGKTPPSPAPD